MMFDVKLVPLSDKNADGRWAYVEAKAMWVGRVIGDDLVVDYKCAEPPYRCGGYPTPEFRIT